MLAALPPPPTPPPTSPPQWVPLTTKIVETLYLRHRAWMKNRAEIQRRMKKLRIEPGWTAEPQLQAALDYVTREDDYFAANDMAFARRVLKVAEADVTSTRPHRLARIKALEERTKRLELVAAAGWRPLGDKKWPDPEVIAWCAMFGCARLWDLDDWERCLAHFESRLPPRPKLQLGPRLLGRNKRKR
jgi:hypothetical protein